VGDRFLRQRLVEQNECLSGKKLRCYELSRDERFLPAERQAFALRACRAGDDSGCGLLARALGPAHGVASAEAQALDDRCQSGNPDFCQRLGVHLLTIGDVPEGTRRLEQSCALDVRWCDSAARAAGELGAGALARRLRQRGCEHEDARACRGLLQQVGGSLEPDARARLELRTCLLGDINDCRPLMSLDLRGVCSEICAGTTESRMHSCGYCAREAQAAGALGLAETWHAGSCARGYGSSCRDLQELQRARLSAGPAQVTRDP
jgi:hypothetical protein